MRELGLDVYLMANFWGSENYPVEKKMVLNRMREIRRNSP